MNKGAIIGIIIVLAVGIGITSSMYSTEDSEDKLIVDEILLEDELVVDEIIPEEELIVDEILLEDELVVDEIIPEEELEEPEETGRNITVELKESIGLKSP